MAENPTAVYFIGTAGAGKTTMLAAYDQWCRQHGLTTLTINLDPGAEDLPYEPDIDIRERVILSDIMADHGLGPNGAQIAAADMIALDIQQIIEDVQSFRADQILIDTPGQVELFVFRHAGKIIVESLNPGRSVIAYLLDPFLARTATGFASQMMLGATTFFRFQEPMTFLLSKADVMDEESLQTVLSWAADSDALEQDILTEEASMQREFAADITRLLGTMGVENTLVPISSVENSGFDDLYALIQQAIGQSEDSTPEFDTFLGQGQENPE